MRFPIEGMICTSCVGRITRAVRKLPGVESVKVDLASETATVAFDSQGVSPEEIAAAVEKAGYIARLDAAEHVEPVEADVAGPGRRRLARWLPLLR